MNGAVTRERVFQLQVDQATVGLSAAERLELEAALTRDPGLDDPSLELAAASIDLACLGEVEPLPKSLRSTLCRQADDFVISRQRFAKVTPIASRREASRVVVSSPSRDRRRRGTRSTLLPWLVAAAATLIAVIGWLRPADESPVADAPTSVSSNVVLAAGDPDSGSRPGVERAAEAGSDAAERRETLAASPSALHLSWAATEDPAARGASGDLVWNNERQEGFMRFAGLAPNDPAETRYQLWIFDATRDDRFPVDGGLFDVPESGEVVVPIDARLRVGEPVLFAVTIEKPEGVVVSNRERVVVLAQST